MQLRDIQYVIAAAEAGSFSKAALVVHVSQPALSQMIQRLEDELGVKLFIRKSNKVILTEEGAIFCEEGREILNRSQHLISRMREFKELTQGKLSIAIAPFYQKNFLLPFLAEFRKKISGNHGAGGRCVFQLLRGTADERGSGSCTGYAAVPQRYDSV